MTNRRPTWALGIAASLAVAALAWSVASSRAQDPQELEPLLTKLRSFTTLYMYLAIGAPDGMHGFSIYVARDGRAVVDEADPGQHNSWTTNDHRWYWDGRRAWHDSPYERRGGMPDPMAPSLVVMDDVLAYAVPQLLDGMSDIQFTPDRPTILHHVFQVLPQQREVPFAVTVEIGRRDGMPSHLSLRDPNGKQVYSAMIHDLVFDGPVPKGTFQRLRTQEACITTKHEHWRLSCAPPSADPATFKCAQGEDPCELPYPDSMPASAYKKGGKCASHGRATPDGIPGC